MVQVAMESAALDGAITRRTGVAVFVDMDAVADRAMPDPAAMREIRGFGAIAGSGINVPAAAWRNADHIQPVFSPAFPPIAQFSGRCGVERADGQLAVKALTRIEATVAEQQLFDPEAGIAHG